MTSIGKNFIYGKKKEHCGVFPCKIDTFLMFAFFLPKSKRDQ